MIQLYIKNMVCSRCKMVVSQELAALGLHPISIELGEVVLQEEIDKETQEKLNVALKKLGFELIEDKKSRIVEKTKNVIVEWIHYSYMEMRVNYSEYIVEKLHYDYHYLSNLFSEVEGKPISSYIIQQKIERVKELLMYDELTLNEIADRLGYSNASYLSLQFKKTTGLTPTEFKLQSPSARINLEEL